MLNGQGGTVVGRDETPQSVALRAEMVQQLQRHERISAPDVTRAFAEVPRHLFLPDVSLTRAYADEAVVTKWSATHLPLSSASQPSMIALMLEQLAVQPGMRVLEVGAGTGYNAALLAHLAGPDGHVTTIDIDVDIVATAQAHLASAGWGPERVTVVCGDGAEGWTANAPYDRIILTVGAWDVAPAWFAQLVDGGRLVLPLALHTTQISVALDRAGDVLRSTSLRSCGFIRLRGAFTGPEMHLTLSVAPNVTLLAEPPMAEAEHVAALLNTPPRILPLTTSQIEGVRHTLALTEPHTVTLLATPPHSLLGQTATGILTPEGDSACFLGIDSHGAQRRVEYGAATAGLAMERAMTQWLDLGEPTLDEWQLQCLPISDAKEQPDVGQNGHFWLAKTHWLIEAWVPKQAAC